MSPSTNGTTNGTSSSSKNGGVSTLTSADCISLEKAHSAHNYHPLPIVFSRASGAHVWDPEGKQYIDCLSAYSAVNQGHCHPKIVTALTEQAQTLTLSSRAFYTNQLGPTTKFITETLGFEMCLLMNTGAEAVETALKVARKWAYKVKGVEKDKARILSVSENFHGRTLGIVSMSTDPSATDDFGPFLPLVGPVFPSPSAPGGSETLAYNDIPALERALELHGKDTAAFLVEPIQGEAGIVVPAEDYLEKAQELCKKHNVLLIVDEVQTGLGRTGKLLSYHHNPAVKPDMVLLGKALSGGVYPVSAVLSSRDILLTIKPGEHGSTYGGNPLACAVATASLNVILDENLCDRAETLGQKFRADLRALKSPWISEVRGKGLLNAIVIDGKASAKGRGAWELCLLFKSKGLLAKPTHDTIIRLAPPLVISEEDLNKVVEIIKSSLDELDTIAEIPGLKEDQEH